MGKAGKHEAVHLANGNGKMSNFKWRIQDFGQGAQRSFDARGREPKVCSK